jgi:hypothetical protein
MAPSGRLPRHRIFGYPIYLEKLDFFDIAAKSSGIFPAEALTAAG